MSLNFTDYIDNPSALIGRKVLSGGIVTTIERVTKTGFAVKGENCLYSLKDGYLKTSDIWNLRKVVLISDDDAIKIQADVKMKREAFHLRSIIKPQLDKLPLEKLKLIRDIISSEQQGYKYSTLE